MSRPEDIARLAKFASALLTAVECPRMNLRLPVVIVSLIAPAVALAQATRQNDQRLLLAGRLLRVEGTSLVIQPRWKPPDTEPVTIATDEHTKCFIDLDEVRLAHLKPGMDLSARRDAPSAEAPKPKLYIHVFTPGLTGTVTRVEAARVVLSVPSAGADASSIAVETNAHTKVHFPFAGSAYADVDVVGIDRLEPGMHVRVVPAEGVARRIFVRPKREPSTTPVGR